MDTKSLQDRDLACIWHPCSQMTDYADFPPLPVQRASGCQIELADGRSILDAISSWWCKSLGHGHPEIAAAIISQTSRFEHVILANTTSELVVGFAERLLQAANGPSTGCQSAEHRFAKVFFADNGSTAVEIALKMALHWQQLAGRPQRTRYAVLANGYHGETVGALSISDLGLYADPYRPLLFPALVLDALPWRQGPEDPRWLDAADAWPGIAAQLDRREDLAAIVYEPVLQGAGGMRLLSPDLLPRLRAWADAHDVLLIADEVASGMGRCGAMLASHLAGPGGMPDLAVVSKGLTGGTLPLSCVLAPDRIYDAFLGPWHSRRAFLHSNTYAGNALAVAAADAALRIFARDDVCGQAGRSGARMRSALAAAAAGRPWLGPVRGVGMVAALELRARDGSALDPAQRTGFRVYQEAVRRGALLRPLGDTMYLFPPLNAAWDDLEAMIAILVASADAVIR